MLNFFQRLAGLNAPAEVMAEVRAPQVDPAVARKLAEDRLRLKSIKLRYAYAKLCGYNQPNTRRKACRKRGYEEFPLLCQHPLVEQVGINLTEHSLVLGTRPILLKHHRGGPLHVIGQFVVTIYAVEESTSSFDASTDESNVIAGFVPLPGFRCVNLTPNKHGMHHPHINDEGYFCINSGYGYFNLARAQGRLLDAADWVLTALNTYGPGSPYTNGDLPDWPVYTPSTQETGA